MPEFIPGIQLSEAYYQEAVRPILDRHFPRLRHSAALIGYGSDVLGYDTSVSRDHMWGPRLLLFLPSEELETTRQAVDDALRTELPVRFYGYSTHFGKPNPNDNGVRISEEIETGPVEHLIFLVTIASFFQDSARIDPFRDPTPAEWLTIPQQLLLEWTAGKVFHDDLGLKQVRERFAYYPHDVWLYLLAAQWAQLGEIEAFAGRTWQTGDELGSRLIAAKIVERLMRLCFLIEHRYAPYAKWFGTAFKRLACYHRIGPLLDGVLSAPTYPKREQFLVRAYTQIAEMHNSLQVTPPVEARTRTYSGWHAYNAGKGELSIDDPGNTRPHQVIFAGRFESALRAAIHDPQVLALIPNLGSVSQFLVESSPAVEDIAFCRSLEDNLRLRS